MILLNFFSFLLLSETKLMFISVIDSLNITYDFKMVAPKFIRPCVVGLPPSTPFSFSKRVIEINEKKPG